LAIELQAALTNVATSGVEVLGDTPYSYLAPELAAFFDRANSATSLPLQPRRDRNSTVFGRSNAALSNAALSLPMPRSSVQFVNTRRDPKSWARSRVLHHGVDLICRDPASSATAFSAWSLLGCSSSNATTIATPFAVGVGPDVGPEFATEQAADGAALEAHFATHQRRLTQLLGPCLLQVCLWDVPEADGAAHLQSMLRTLVNPVFSSAAHLAT
jgi:hypothetical protein